MEKIVPSLVGEVEMVVCEEHTARHLGSGDVAVFATPEMVRLMERASVAAVDHLLPSGFRTVGARIDVRHFAPTPIGMKVTARAELIAARGRRLTFRVEAFDEREKIGEGLHYRVIVDLEKFKERARAKGG
jgi:predicted thioesterase